MWVFSRLNCSFDHSYLFNWVQLQGSMFLQGDLLISPNLNATTPSVGMQVNTPASMLQGLKVVSSNTSSTALVVSVRMVFFFNFTFACHKKYITIITCAIAH